MFEKLAAALVDFHDNHPTAYYTALSVYGAAAGVAVGVLNKKICNVPKN